MLRSALFALAMTVVSTTAASAHFVTRDLNLRAGPGTGHGQLHVLPRCADIRVHGQSRGWYNISWQGYRGWVSARYVSAQRPNACRVNYRPHPVPVPHIAPWERHPYYHHPRPRRHGYREHRDYDHGPRGPGHRRIPVPIFPNDR